MTETIPTQLPYVARQRVADFLRAEGCAESTIKRKLKASGPQRWAIYRAEESRSGMRCYLLDAPHTVESIVLPADEFNGLPVDTFEIPSYAGRVLAFAADLQPKPKAELIARAIDDDTAALIVAGLRKLGHHNAPQLVRKATFDDMADECRFALERLRENALALGFGLWAMKERFSYGDHFADFLASVGLGKSQGYAYIRAAKVMANLIVRDTAQLPTSIDQCIELHKAGDAEAQASLWEVLTEDDSQPAAKEIRQWLQVTRDDEESDPAPARPGVLCSVGPWSLCMVDGDLCLRFAPDTGGADCLPVTSDQLDQLRDMLAED